MVWAVLLNLIYVAEGSAARVFVLETEAGVTDVAARDVNADGHNDIVALCSDEAREAPNRHVAVFLADPEDFLPAKPTFTLDLDPAAGALFFAEVDGRPPAELVVTADLGAQVYRFERGRFMESSRPRFKSLLPRALAAPVFLDIAEDLDGDGIDEWLVPVASGYQVRTATGVRAEIACGVSSGIKQTGGLSISHRLPAVHTFQRPGDPQRGLVFLNRKAADFAYGEDFSERTRYEFPSGSRKEWDVAAEMRDIDGDGLPDLVLTETRGAIGREVVAHVYLAAAPGVYPEAPLATFECQGAVASPLLEDVDGDKKLDLLLIRIPYNVKSFISLFVLKKVTVHVDVYLFDGKGYAEKPDLRQNITLAAPEERGQIEYTMGDFNGDGRLDAAFGTSGDKLVVHTGKKKKFLSQRPWMEVAVPATGTARVYELGGGRGQDLVIFHPGAEHNCRIEVVVF
ncbi:MAG TPA: VCBS repeat-containing protein [Candidatus Hydrogenedentes bacterium]|nr:VCBS repeat-containing protein [Candidatus Hydrogenedentota bacterium]HIJ73189.1 VCBS repeat-containing protein [Candidatus Hydrogenedentota bacterium]